MPCNNVTELMRVVLDPDDRIEQYRFIKHTCGSGVGADSLLIDYFHNRPLAEVLALDVDTFCDRYPTADEFEMFLILKHFFAIQSVLGAYAGNIPGGAGEACAIAGIGQEDGHVVIDAEIIVDIVTDKIKACGRCEGCGTKKGERKTGRLKKLREDAARHNESSDSTGDAPTEISRTPQSPIVDSNSSSFPV
jgi:hypothetical protein